MIIEISIDDLSDRYSNTLHAYETEKDITKLPLYDKIKQYRSSKRLDWKGASDKDIYNNNLKELVIPHCFPLFGNYQNTIRQ